MKKTNASGKGSGNGLDKYRRLLLSKKTELLAPLRSKPEIFGEARGGAPEDLAPVFHDQFVALQLNRVGFQELKLVEAALQRIENNDYGVCLSCGQSISTKRLEAIPWAICCLDCQERLSSPPGSTQRVAFA